MLQLHPNSHIPSLILELNKSAKPSFTPATLRIEQDRYWDDVARYYRERDAKAEAPGADLVTGSNNEEQTALTQSNAAIGMLSYAWLNEDVRGLSIISDDGDIIEASLENIRSGRFPFVRNLNVVTREDVSPFAQEFIAYLLADGGQELVEESGYIRVSN